MSNAQLETLENTLANAVHRPWGWYASIQVGEGFQVKLIVVNPGESLSLQSHSKRSEHWVLINGIATITVGDDVTNYSTDQHIYIPCGAKHRLQNQTEREVRLVEVQLGSYVGEDDIVRYSDIYGRV